MIVEGIYFVFRVAVLFKKKSFLLISHSSTRNTRICVRISPSTRACFFTFWISMMSYSQLPAVLCLIAPRKPLEPLCTCASISPLPPGHILFAFQHISFPLAKGLIAKYVFPLNYRQVYYYIGLIGGGGENKPTIRASRSKFLFQT